MTDAELEQVAVRLLARKHWQQKRREASLATRTRDALRRIVRR